jgi:pRiA4b ORF-3-like protein
VEQRIYQMKVTLLGSQPPIWRRVLVPHDTTLGKFHQVLQVTIGWTGRHLHQYRCGDTYYGVPDPEFGMECLSEKRTLLAEVLTRPGSRMVYEYDFGDGWEHDVVLEKILAPVPDQVYPIAADGKGACPPEDVGGIGGYIHFLEAMHDHTHPDHPEMVDWCGGSFDPDRLDLNLINRALKRRRKSTKRDA